MRFFFPKFMVYFLQLKLCFILLQGLNPELSGYEAALALYEREAGPKPEKVCHLGFFFLSTCS